MLCFVFSCDLVSGKEQEKQQEQAVRVQANTPRATKTNEEEKLLLQ